VCVVAHGVLQACVAPTQKKKKEKGRTEYSQAHRDAASSLTIDLDVKVHLK
jgi:hypothetical protein